MQYTIIEAIDAYKLIQEVARLLADGWRCQGGVAVYQTRHKDGYTYEVYMQALVREGEE